jgi:hypothetical protein
MNAKCFKTSHLATHRHVFTKQCLLDASLLLYIQSSYKQFACIDLQPFEQYWWAECINIVQQAFNLPTHLSSRKLLKSFTLCVLDCTNDTINVKRGWEEGELCSRNPWKIGEQFVLLWDSEWVTGQGCNFRCDVTGTDSVQQWTLRLSPIVFIASKGSSVSVTTPWHAITKFYNCMSVRVGKNKIYFGVENKVLRRTIKS